MSQDQNILDMNKCYEEAVTKLQQWRADPSDMLTRKECIFAGVLLKEDRQLHALLQFPTEEEKKATESLVIQLLEAVEIVVKRQLKDQLPGGIFWDPSPNLQKQAKSASCTNISGERKFAASMGKIESKVMFKYNKTNAWLKAQKKDKRKQNILQSISLGRKIRKENRARETEQRKRLKERLKKMRREERLRLRQEHLIED